MDRDAFLNLLAERLKRPRMTSPPPRDVRGVPEFYRERPLAEGASAEGASPEKDLAKRFKQELETLGGQVYIEGSPGGAAARLKSLLAELKPRTIVSWAHTEFHDLDLAWLWGDLGYVEYRGRAEPFRAAALRADVGITTADAAIANTGTLVLTTSPARPRSVSLTPAVHIALVRKDQLVARMGEALARFGHGEGRGMPSGLFYITGPSRTADIEGDLSIGVHGPAAVSVILWDSPAASVPPRP